jgi:hypothetical protein
VPGKRRESAGQAPDKRPTSAGQAPGKRQAVEVTIVGALVQVFILDIPPRLYLPTTSSYRRDAQTTIQNG